MNKEHNYIVFDTETKGLDEPFIYDLGLAVCNRKGEVKETKNLVIKEMWVDHRDLLNTAYYADKLPQYEEELANGTRELVSWYEAKQIFKELCEKYNVKAIMAHNAFFDYKATKFTQEFFTNGKYHSFLPYGIELWDTLAMARSAIAPMKKYQKFCKENGYLTSKNQPRLTAEILYRFISGNNDFIEAHTGLEDVLIEKEIFAYCTKRKVKMKRQLFSKKPLTNPA